MNINASIRFVCFTILLLATQLLGAAQNGFSDAEADAIQTFLRAKFGTTNAGMVIGLVDERRSRVLSAGKLDNGTDGEVNGDTIFEIGSATKTFTTLLLQDMVEQAELKLEDPVATYLPASVRMPAYNGKPITLLHLATHTSGLPRDPDNFPQTPAVAENPWADYTTERLYAFLSGYVLTQEPGTHYEYSNVGMGLLGHAIELKGATNYESLVLDRICRPLQMGSTRVTLTPDLKSRLAQGHNVTGKPTPNWDLPSMVGAGGLRSSVNDLLRYLSAQVGITQSRLTPIAAKTHVIRHRNSPGSVGDMHGNTALAWYDQGVYQPPGMDLLGHGGATGGYSTFIGFDKKQRRGVAVLSNQTSFQSPAVGWAVLQRLLLTKESGTELVREIVGLGFMFDLDQKTHTLRITKVYPKSSAGQAGLSSGLIIQTINTVPTVGKSTAECFSLLRANGSPKVRLELVSPERKETNTVELTRGKFLTSG